MPYPKRHSVRESTKAKIESALRAMIDENPIRFKLNIKELERKSGISRTTLCSPNARKTINDYLESDKRVSSAKKRDMVEVLAENAALKMKLEEVTADKDDLFILYLELFYKIHGESAYSKLGEQEDGDTSILRTWMNASKIKTR